MKKNCYAYCVKCSSCLSGSHFLLLSAFPSVRPDSLLEEELGDRQADGSGMLLFFTAWWTALIGGHSDLIWLLFWLPQTSYLRGTWVESSPRRTVQRRDNTPWLQVIIYPQSRVTRPGTNTSICRHGYGSGLIECQESILRLFVFSTVIVWRQLIHVWVINDLSLLFAAIGREWYWIHFIIHETNNSDWQNNHSSVFFSRQREREESQELRMLGQADHGYIIRYI